MMFTIPLVTYGIFRYMYLIYQKEDGGSPTVMLLTDPPLLLCAIIWMAACIHNLLVRQSSPEIAEKQRYPV
jgi:hypothetical protein